MDKQHMTSVVEQFDHILIWSMALARLWVCPLWAHRAIMKAIYPLLHQDLPQSGRSLTDQGSR